MEICTHWYVDVNIGVSSMKSEKRRRTGKDWLGRIVWILDMLWDLLTGPR